ncbi:MAG TPA: T9SS type A sorting domain-containing protein [Ignavibacteria bacterium]|nr:T9SS type A sorting domain-containing protein [Ignavibacteria bacterium]
MKKLIQYLIPAAVLSFGFYFLLYNTTIMFVQTVPNDSLLIGHDRSLHVGDTVTVVGRVVAPAVVNASGNDFRILLRGSSSRTIYIQDTTNALWGGIIVRQGDTVHNTGITNLDSGMKVQVSGIVDEFPPLPLMSSSVTQIALDTLQVINILPTIKKRPAPIQVNVTDFDSLGNTKIFTGEKYEGMYVQLNNLTVGPQSSSGSRHIRRLLDANGNFIYLRDFSNFFSIFPTPSWGWTPWSPPSIGATVTSIRGVIIHGGYNDALNGLYPYVIVPIYPNDLVLGNTPPFVSNVTRIPGVPKPTDSVQVNVTVVDTLDHPLAVDSVQLFYRINKGTYIKKPMTAAGNIYFTKMPPQSLGTLVEYFVRAKDNQGAVRLNPSDTGKSTYFYYVRNSDTMTIKDIQYTPNNGGFSGYNGYDVTTEGIVSCDTTDISAGSITTPGGTQSWPRRVIIQDPAITNGWSGIWINGNPTDYLRRGDRVRVRGTVEESNGMTRLNIAQPTDIVMVSQNNPIPGFQILNPGDVSDYKIDGDTTAEKWESVLIKFQNQVVVICVNAASGTGCSTELPLPDTAFRRNFGEMFVEYSSIPGQIARVELQDGTHSKVNGWDPLGINYYNQSPELMWKWHGIGYLQGVLYYGFNHYKLVPRKNDDFGSIIGVEPMGEIATSFWIKQNYPNPFNPVTTITYNIPDASEVTLKVYNLLGQEIVTLVHGIQNKGRYDIKFDGLNIASGLYIYVLEANSLNGLKFRDVKKMVLVK